MQLLMKQLYFNVSGDKRKENNGEGRRSFKYTALPEIWGHEL